MGKYLILLSVLATGCYSTELRGDTYTGTTQITYAGDRAESVQFVPEEGALTIDGCTLTLEPTDPNTYSKVGTFDVVCDSGVVYDATAYTDGDFLQVWARFGDGRELLFHGSL